MEMNFYTSLNIEECLHRLETKTYLRNSPLGTHPRYTRVRATNLERMKPVLGNWYGNEFFLRNCADFEGPYNGIGGTYYLKAGQHSNLAFYGKFIQQGDVTIIEGYFDDFWAVEMFWKFTYLFPVPILTIIWLKNFAEILWGTWYGPSANQFFGILFSVTWLFFGLHLLCSENRSSFSLHPDFRYMVKFIEDTFEARRFYKSGLKAIR